MPGSISSSAAAEAASRAGEASSLNGGSIARDKAVKPPDDRPIRGYTR
jgi:hypothetical protein